MSGSIPSGRAGRTQLQEVIADLTEGVIFLDPDGAVAWANATALALHRVGTVAGLGRTADEYSRRFTLRYRNGEALAAAEYPMARLLAGEAFSELVVLVTPAGQDRRWVHQIRTLALTDPEGEPDCLVLILNDETERFNAEERFERAFGANPAPAIIARLSDMRYVKVNHGFMEMTGYQRDALIGHSVHEIDVLRHAERRDLAVARLHAGQTIPQMEGCLLLPNGQEKFVLLGGQPIEIGDAACMLFTFADLHPRKLAEGALRHSEERFAKAFRMAPGPMAIVALEGMQFLDVNDAFTAATGWRREEVLGRSAAEMGLWGQDAQRAALERQLTQTGHVRSADVQVRAKAGGWRDYLLSVETVTIHGAPCVLSVMQDITERRRTETELVTAIEAVMQDTSWFGQRVVEKLASLSHAGSHAGSPGPELAALTGRSREVLELMAQGLPDAEIGMRLGISRNTVRNHVSAIYARLGVHRRSAVVVWARERGIGVKGKPLANRRKTRAKATG